MADVVLKAVSKVYPNGVRAVEDLNLTIQDHETFVLLGPSGCGKTTTLRLIAGLEAASSGSIHIDGKDVTDEPAHTRGVAMLFQTPALYPHLSVRDNLVFGASGRYNFLGRWLGRRLSTDLSERLAEVARTLQVDGLLDRRPGQLSGGERQRVALGRAMIRRSAVFLLDEPLAHVDPALRGELRQELKLLHRRLGVTMIWVTHDHAEALALGDRIGVMSSGGALQQVGTPETVYRLPSNRAVAELVGFPVMNLLPGRLTMVNGVLRLLGQQWSLPVDADMASAWSKHQEQAVLLGIRPAEVRIATGEETGLALSVSLIEYGEGTYWVRLVGPQLRVACKAVGERLPSVGEIIRVNWNWQQTHLFDATTGNRLAVSPERLAVSPERLAVSPPG